MSHIVFLMALASSVHQATAMNLLAQDSKPPFSFITSA